MEPTFFATPQDFRRWLGQNHQTETEVLVGFYRKDSGKPSITWPESVDQALCFGWIDGVRRSRDAESYTIRFTPRKATSIWSAVNIRKAEELTKAGLMHQAGLAAFARRDAARSAVYSYEQRHDAALTPEQEQEFRSNAGAWDYFNAQAAWYRKSAIWWVVSAKREETRAKRLATLIDSCGQGRHVPALARPEKN